MTLTMTLTPDKELRLAEQARAAGLSLDDYVQRVIAQTAGENSQTAQMRAERIARFFEWAESHSKDTPVLSDEAIIREALSRRD